MSRYNLIVSYLKGFEQTLDANHEVWVQFPKYDALFLLQSTQTGGDDFIAFELLSENGEIISVIQSYSQLNFAVFSKQKANLANPPHRVGFITED